MDLRNFNKFLLIRKLSFVKIFFVVSVAVTIADANTISCSRVATSRWMYLNNVKTCIMDDSTSISTIGYKISSARDESVIGIELEHLRNMFYLPDSPSDKFPNLQGYSAVGSSVKEISGANFKNLRKLSVIFLDNNQIEKIHSDAFSDLESLKWLNMGTK
jgi:hypothetical protein